LVLGLADVLVVDTAARKDNDTSEVEIFVLAKFKVVAHDVFVMELSSEQSNSNSHQIRSDDGGGDNENNLVQDEGQNTSNDSAENLCEVKISSFIGGTSECSIENANVKDVTSNETQCSSNNENSDLSELVSGVTKSQTQSHTEKSKDPENGLLGGDIDLGIEEHARGAETNDGSDGKDGEFDQLETKEVKEGTKGKQDRGKDGLVFLNKVPEEVNGTGASETGFASDGVDGGVGVGSGDHSVAEFSFIGQSLVHVALKDNNNLSGIVESFVVVTVFDLNSWVGNDEAFSGVILIDQRVFGKIVCDDVLCILEDFSVNSINLGAVGAGNVIVSNTKGDIVITEDC